jgi:hypothetical protein
MLASRFVGLLQRCNPSSPQHDKAAIMKKKRRHRATTLLLIMLPLPISGPLMAAKSPKLPPNAPYCALPGTPQTFVSPMGEPFRAAAGQPYPSAVWVAAADANHDGAIDRAEFLADAQRFFRTLDTDHEGRLTPEEIIAYEANVAPEIALYRGRRMAPLGSERETGQRPHEDPLPDLLGVVPQRISKNDDRDYGGPMGAGRFTWLNIPEPVSSTDADIDRLVSAAEFAAAASRRYDTLTAGQGLLKIADLPKTPAQMSLEGPCVPRKAARQDQRRENENSETRERGRPQ